MNPRIAVNIFFLINGLIIATLASRFVQIQEIYILSNKQLGFLLLAMSIGAFIGMPITGWLIHRFGSKRITTIAGLCMPIGLLILPWSPVWSLLFIPFFMVGASNGIMDVAMNAQAVEVEKLWKRSIMTFFHALFSVGMMIGAGIGSICISSGIHPRLHFMSVAIFSFIILALTSSYLLKEEAQEQEEDNVLFAWPTGALIALGIIAFCCMMGEGAMADWSAIYMEKIVEAEKSLQVAGLFAFSALMALARFMGDGGRDKYGDKRMMMIGAFTSLLGIAMILTVLHPYVVILGFGLVGLGLANVVPIVYSLAGNYPGVQPGVGIAAATTIGYTGFMAGPPLIGFLADAFDLRFALGCLGALFVVMAILVLAYKPKKAL